MKNINLTIKEAEFCFEALKTLIQLHYDHLVICTLWPQIGRRWNRIDLGDTPLMKDRCQTTSLSTPQTTRIRTRG